MRLKERGENSNLDLHRARSKFIRKLVSLRKVKMKSVRKQFARKSLGQHSSTRGQKSQIAEKQLRCLNNNPYMMALSDQPSAAVDGSLGSPKTIATSSSEVHPMTLRKVSQARGKHLRECGLVPIQLIRKVNFDAPPTDSIIQVPDSYFKKMGCQLFSMGVVLPHDKSVILPARTAEDQYYRLQISDLLYRKPGRHPAATHVANGNRSVWIGTKIDAGEVCNPVRPEMVQPASIRQVQAASPSSTPVALCNRKDGCELNCSSGKNHGRHWSAGLNQLLNQYNKQEITSRCRQRRRAFVSERKRPYGSDSYILVKRGSRFVFAEELDRLPRYRW